MSSAGIQFPLGPRRRRTVDTPFDPREEPDPPAERRPSGSMPPVEEPPNTWWRGIFASVIASLVVAAAVAAVGTIATRAESQVRIEQLAETSRDHDRKIDQARLDLVRVTTSIENLDATMKQIHDDFVTWQKARRGGRP